jgi:hypothetical protein
MDNWELLKVPVLINRIYNDINSLMANPSLNRTFCGSQLLGFISFSPNIRLPQNAG